MYKSTDGGQELGENVERTGRTRDQRAGLPAHPPSRRDALLPGDRAAGRIASTSPKGRACIGRPTAARPGSGSTGPSPCSGRRITTSIRETAASSIWAPPMRTNSVLHATRRRFIASSEQTRRQLVQVVPPVDPGVSAAADVQLVLDAVLLEQLRQALRAVAARNPCRRR